MFLLLGGCTVDGREDLPLVGGLEDDDDDVEPAAALDRSNRELDESKDFYEILQQQMAEYLATAKAFVSSTESTRRVQAWHDMIRPRLLEAETRRDFDIHQYGSQILSEFGAEAPIGSRTRFSSVVRTLPKNEVARYFLATLQLVTVVATHWTQIDTKATSFAYLTGGLLLFPSLKSPFI